MFQFPLHRDPRCNIEEPGLCNSDVLVSVPFTSGSSLQLERVGGSEETRSFSSLYIGILAATVHMNVDFFPLSVSVPFTSGSSLQLRRHPRCNQPNHGFSSLYIGILAATNRRKLDGHYETEFQFPLHRDPRCNHLHYWFSAGGANVSVPFTSGSSLQPRCPGH